jgi:Tfp pilus assembly protein PilX
VSGLDTLAKQIRIARNVYNAALAKQERAQKALTDAGKAVNAAAEKVNRARNALMSAAEPNTDGGYALYLGAG